MIGVEEVYHLHDVAMRASGDEPTRLIPREAERLRQAIGRAALWAEGRGPLGGIAAVAAMVLMTEAFREGNRRTALLVLATLLERSGEPHTIDWMAAARVLAQPHQHAGHAMEGLIEVLEPR